MAKANQVREKRALYTRTPGAKNRRPRPHLELLGTEVPAEVVRFCNREHILDHLIHAGELIPQCFPNVASFELEVKEDPETGEKAVVMVLVVSGAIDEVQKQDELYSAAWVHKVPWPASDKIVLCLGVASEA